MKKIIFIIAIALTVLSCKKEEELTPSPQQQTNPTTESFTSLDAYFDSHSVQTEIFQLTAENGGTFTTSKGSIITIPANSLITQSGQPVTGAVSLKMKEVFSTSDMIFSGIFPISYGNVLNSGGEYFIEASQNGAALRVQDGEFISVDIPAQAEDPCMQLFLAGGDELADSVNWMLADSTSGSGFTFNSADNSYECDMDSLGWANIDAFMSNVSYFNCDFNLSGVLGLNSSNTTAFAKFKNRNSVWPVGVSGWGSISGNIIFETHLAGVDLNLLVISVVNGQLYYGVLDAIPAQNQTYQITMSEITSAELDVVINGLP